MTSKYYLQPTSENLERFKRNHHGFVYWHTNDFWLYDSELSELLKKLYDQATDDFFEICNDPRYDGSTYPDDVTDRILAFRIGRRVIQAAREASISPKDLAIQLNNLQTIIMTPICIWQVEENSDPCEMTYSLRSNLPR